MAIYLESFIGSQPDVVGWTDYLATLAMESRIDPESIKVRGDEIRGQLQIPDSTLSLDYALSDDGYTIKFRGSVYLPSIGDVHFRSNISGGVHGDTVDATYGVVQFYPREHEVAFGDRPVGYVYSINERNSSFGAITSHPNGGIVVPPSSQYETVESASLGPAQSLLFHLQGE